MGIYWFDVDGATRMAVMRQTIKPISQPFHCKITLPGSKALTHRALLLAALADGVSEISGIRLTESTRTLISALHQLGIVTQIDEKSSSCIIAGGNGKFPKKQSTVWCANSRTTARFILSACASNPGVFYFDGGMNLRQKNLAHILHLLCRQGAQLIPNDSRHLPLTMVGADSLQGGEVNLDEEVNSQILSALLMISPYARIPFSFNGLDLANQPLINMTCALMNEFGVLVHRYHQSQFTVPVPQRYLAKDLTIEPDFTVCAYFFAAAAATTGSITIQPVKAITSKQSDVQILDILKAMGCSIQEAYNGLTVKGCTELQGIEISLCKFSATFFALTALAPFAKSPTRITHVGAMNKKDKEQLMAVKSEFTKLNIQIEIGDNWLKIFPSTPKGCLLNSHHNPYLAMALAIIGLRVPNVEIDNALCVKSIFPDFFKLWGTLSKQEINV